MQISLHEKTTRGRATQCISVFLSRHREANYLLQLLPAYFWGVLVFLISVGEGGTEGKVPLVFLVFSSSSSSSGPFCGRALTVYNTFNCQSIALTGSYHSFMDF